MPMSRYTCVLHSSKLQIRFGSPQKGHMQLSSFIFSHPLFFKNTCIENPINAFTLTHSFSTLMLFSYFNIPIFWVGFFSVCIQDRIQHLSKYWDYAEISKFCWTSTLSHPQIVSHFWNTLGILAKKSFFLVPTAL